MKQNIGLPMNEYAESRRNTVKAPRFIFCNKPPEEPVGDFVEGEDGSALLGEDGGSILDE